MKITVNISTENKTGEQENYNICPVCWAEFVTPRDPDGIGKQCRRAVGKGLLNAEKEPDGREHSN